MERYAVVTGASSGLGKEYALWLAEHSYITVLVARREEVLQDIAVQLKNRGFRAEIFVCDISKEEECQRLYKHLKGKNIYFAVNAAGIGIAGEFEKSDISKSIKVVNTNICAPTLLTGLFAGIMDKGYIINIASTAAFQPGPGMSVYGASKAYIVSFSLAVNEELRQAKRALRIVTVCPGPLETDFDKNAGIPKKESYSRKLFTVPVKKCVEYTFKSIKKGKTFVIPGAANRILAAAGRFVPRSVMLKAEYNIQMGKIR